MKTRNQFEAIRRVAGLIAMAIIAIAVICLPLAGCKSDEPTDTPTQEQPVGYITDTAGNQIIPIYKTDGVSDTTATTAVNNIKTAWNDSKLDSYRNILSIGINKIYILEGDSVYLYSFDKATGILKVGSGWTLGTYIDCFQYDVYPDLTKRTLTFGTPEAPVTASVTITSDDQFTADEWKTLCDKTVAAIMRGYGVANIVVKGSITTYFTNNTVTAVLLKSATYDVEVKSTVPNTMYFKANGSTIDGISAANMFSIINEIVLGGSYHIPSE